MADVFQDGFDKYGVTGQRLFDNSGVYSAGSIFLNEWNAQANGSQTAGDLVAGRFSGQALSLGTIQNGTQTVTKTLPGGNYATLIFGFALEQTPLSAAQNGITFTDGTTDQLTVCVNTSGKIEVRNGGITGTVVATSTQSISAGTWHYISGSVTINNTTGAYQVYLDGVATSINATGQNTRQSANNFANAIRLASTCTSNGSNPAWFDDLLIWDTTGATNNTIPGDSRIETQFPNSDSSVQFAIGAGVLGKWWRGTNTTNAPGANQLVLIPFTPPVSCTINSIGILPEATSATANFKGVIYADSSGAPGSLLSSGTQVTGCASGTALTLPLTTPQSLTGGTQYWMGYITDTSVVLAQAYQSLDPLIGQRKSNTYGSGAPNPAGTGFTTAQPTWTIWGNVTGQSTNYSEVNTSPPAGNLSYTTSSTVNQVDLFGFPALSSTPAAIYSVKMTGYIEKSDAGARTFDWWVSSSSATSGGSNTGITPSGGSYSFQTSYFDTDPNTAVAWTASGLNAALSGYKLVS